MLRKLISVLLLFIVMMTSLAGCSLDLACGIAREYEDNIDGFKNELYEWEDGIKREFDEWLSSISKYSLTKDKNLKGKRELGIDDYVGSYEAEYSSFNGKEYIFGGTAAERENGSTLKVTYSFNIQSGTATLYWLGSPDEHISGRICRATNTFTVMQRGSLRARTRRRNNGTHSQSQSERDKTVAGNERISGRPSEGWNSRGAAPAAVL